MILELRYGGFVALSLEEQVSISRKRNHVLEKGIKRRKNQKTIINQFGQILHSPQKINYDLLKALVENLI